MVIINQNGFLVHGRGNQLICRIRQLFNFRHMGEFVAKKKNMQDGAVLAAAAAWMPLLDTLENVMCWVKDADGRFVAANAGLAESAGLPVAVVAGRTDADLYAAEFAAVYRRDDEAVLASGQAILNKAELINRAGGEVEWRLTSKVALRDSEGRLVGTAGISRRMASDAPDAERGDPLANLIRHARESMAKGLGVAELAARAGVSVATLERRIRVNFGTTPRSFLAELRLNEAAKLLKESNLNVSQVADRTGYESAASFTRAFRRRQGVAPGEFRRRFRRI
jgi:AraC-like DNA-binding protein